MLLPCNALSLCSRLQFWRFNSFGCELTSDTVHIIPVEIRSEYLSHDLFSFFVYYPMLLVERIFHITESLNNAQMLTRIAFNFENATNFLTRVFGILFVDYVPKCRKIIVRLIFAVHTVVYRYEPYIHLR